MEPQLAEIALAGHADLGQAGGALCRRTAASLVLVIGREGGQGYGESEGE
jgi:hypothetical protein